jgi:YesN/AraC family two-component response regulator
MKVLVVDDEPMVRQFVRAILKRNGFEIIEAENGAEALEAAAQHQCDLVITDCLMPGMSGPQLVAQLKERHYVAKYFLISAYKPEEEGSDLPFLAKPFTSAQLMDAIQHLKAGEPDPAQLKHETEKARAQWLRSIEEQAEVLSEVPSQLPGSDGSLLIENAGRKRKAAYLKYMDSLHKYRNCLREPTQPGSPEPKDSGPEE